MVRKKSKGSEVHQLRTLNTTLRERIAVLEAQRDALGKALREIMTTRYGSEKLPWREYSNYWDARIALEALRAAGLLPGEEAKG